MKRLQVWPKDVLACPWRAERGTERVGPSTAVVIIGDAYLRGGSPVLDVRRRHFMTLLGGAAAWPLAARAQQGERMRRIGVLMAAADMEGRARIAAFRRAGSNSIL